MLRRSMMVVALCGMGLGSQAAGQLVVNNFDSGLQAWRFDFGAPNSVLSNDPTMDSTGNPNSGSLKMEMPFDIAQGGNNKFAYTGDVFFPAMNLAATYSEVLFDLKVDPNSAVDAFGNHGFFAFVSRETDGYSYNQLFGINLPQGAGEWTTYSAPASTLLATRAFTVQLYGGPQQNLQGTVTMWMDNIRLVPEPAAGIMILAGILFLRLRAARDGK